MRVLRALFVDDQKADRSRFSGWITRAWKRRSGIEIDLKVAESTELAEKELEKEDYDLLIADILFSKEPLGLLFIHECRQDYPNLAIVALSICDAATMDKAIEAGADEFYSKNTPLRDDISLDLLGERLARALGSHGFNTIPVDEIELLPLDRSLALRATLGAVGERALKAITVELVGSRIEQIDLSLVRGGYSGAAVLAVRCRLAEERDSPPSSKSILLKLSRDQGLIQREHDKQTLVRRFPQGIFPGAISQNPASANGWFGIGTDFIAGARTFASWLQSGGEASRFINSLERLFLKAGLSGVYREARPLAKVRPNCHCFDRLLSDWRLASIQMALEDLVVLCRRYDPFKGSEDAFSSQVIESYLRSGRFIEVDADRPDEGSLEVLSHGDLHSRNLVVDSGERIWLVDAANIESLPWASDFSRLFVDLCLTCLDPGPNSHEWTSIGMWLEIARDLIDGKEPSSGSATVSVLVWMRKHVPDLVPCVQMVIGWEWQLRLCLGIEFLRASYRQEDTPSPKRVFALLAGCLALRRAAVAFEEALALQ